jgi:hypothetical protein
MNEMIEKLHDINNRKIRTESVLKCHSANYENIQLFNSAIRRLLLGLICVPCSASEASYTCHWFVVRAEIYQFFATVALFSLFII